MTSPFRTSDLLESARATIADINPTTAGLSFVERLQWIVSQLLARLEPTDGARSAVLETGERFTDLLNALNSPSALATGVEPEKTALLAALQRLSRAAS